MTKAIALPTKHLFLYMLTRDISLEDAVLDLVDNAIDSLVRLSKISLNDLFRTLSSKKSGGSPPEFTISVRINDDAIEIEDNCGGITFEDAKDVVFRFGRPEERDPSALSVYGIGLKRAVFKIGTDIQISSQAEQSGFETRIRTRNWEREEGWTFDIERLPGKRSREERGTRIVVRRLHEETKERLQKTAFVASLGRAIAQTYCLWLNTVIRVQLNGALIDAESPPLGESVEATRSLETQTIDGVRCTVLATVAEKSREWKAERAGWYIFCNGRAVVSADRSQLTGWGEQFGSFQPKYRGFVGIVFFVSANSEKLPWTTTKRGINKDSFVFLQARALMVATMRPVLRFLDGMYQESETEVPERRAIAETFKPSNLVDALKGKPSSFVIRPSTRAVDDSVKVQFRAKVNDIRRAAKAMGRANLSASVVGKKALEYFIKHECD